MFSPARRASTRPADTTRPASAWTSLVGPLGRGESAAVLGVATASALAVGVRTARRSGWLRGSLVGAVAFDLVGGLVAFQLPATRERYSMKAMRSRLTFALVHVQPFALPLLGEGSWRRAGLRYSTAVASTVALERLAPRSPGRRLIANGVAAALSLVDLATDSSRQRWFGPVFTMKVVGGHGGIPAAPVGS